MKKIIIGARSSKLSLVQTDIVKNLLLELEPRLSVEVKVITTTGDRNMKPIPLDTIGKGWFTKEIDKELLRGSIDIAIHSLKDLPETLPDGLFISAIPAREDAREALVTTNGLTLDAMPKGAVIGTDSSRRRVQILHRRPDLIVNSVRGNVNTRVEKLDLGLYDGLILAVAGLKRLGMENRITQYFGATEFIPSPGQGALAVVSKKSDTSLNSFLKKIDHAGTLAIVGAERAFSKEVGGGCKMPVGAFAELNGDEITVHGMISSLDGEHIAVDTIKGDIDKSVVLAQTLAKRMLKKSAWYRS
jgi:hydroxymethylbilane synthase